MLPSFPKKLRCLIGRSKKAELSERCEPASFSSVCIKVVQNRKPRANHPWRFKGKMYKLNPQKKEEALTRFNPIYNGCIESPQHS